MNELSRSRGKKRKKEASLFQSKRDSSRTKRAMAQSTSLREATRSQEVNAKKGRRLTSLGMTGLGWALQTQSTDRSVCASKRNSALLKAKGTAPEETDAAPEIVAKTTAGFA
jgi:hypothetical protein